ncbi:MAG: periplasmic heavy metal sensor [Candidatus Stahlbacteria bacterium]|nr:MAG: periplasmic heavy metal sensor [Candidatus Stahlbacteria bacterium]
MLRIAAALPLILVGLFGTPRGQHGGPGHFGGLRLRLLLTPQAAEELNLTADQQEKLKELCYSHQEKVLEIKQKIEREQLELKKLMDADEPNESKIKAKVREIGSLRTDLQLTQVDLYFAARNILTDEQIEKIKSLRRGGGRHRGPRRRGGGLRGHWVPPGPGMSPEEMPPTE